MPDFIKPLKIENPAGGGTQVDVYPTEANPSQDYLCGKGLALGATQQVQIYEALGVMLLKDSVVTTPISLASIVQGIQLPRYSLPLTNNGSYVSGQWVGYTESIPGQSAPIVMPRKCTILEMTFSNVNVNCQGNFVFRLGSITGTILYTWNIATGATGKTAAIQALTALQFVANDNLFIQWTKTGGNGPSDCVLVLFIQNN